MTSASSGPGAEEHEGGGPERTGPESGGPESTGHERPPEAASDAPAAAMRIVAGNPTDEELAAAHSVILAVLAEQAARGAERLEPPVDRWRAGARAMREPLTPGAGAWVAGSGVRGY